MEEEDKKSSCVTFSIVKAIATRLIFVVHSFIAIWRVTDVLKDPQYWLMCCVLSLLLIETLITLIKRKGAEWKWFCPSFFFYLCAVVPAIWLLEFDRIVRYRNEKNQNGTNDTALADAQRLSAIHGFVIPISLSADRWIEVLQQTMLLVLILGRWMLPKGDITRDQLSQLLFVYIGMSSDIMEILHLLSETKVLLDRMLSIAVISVWSASLLQFSLVLTQTKGRRHHVALIKRDSGKRRKGCCETEIWAILITILLQDGPFMILRLYCLISYQLVNYSIIFYVSKNLLVLLLQTYRICVLLCDTMHTHTRVWDSQSTVATFVTESPQKSEQSLQKDSDDTETAVENKEESNPEPPPEGPRKRASIVTEERKMEEDLSPVE